jgi:phage portal protein BeeE
MGIFSSMAMAKKTEKRSVPSQIPEFLLGGSATRAGVFVNEDRTLSLSAVWSVLDRISSTMGIFPFKVYRNGKDGKVLQADHPCPKAPAT